MYDQVVHAFRPVSRAGVYERSLADPDRLTASGRNADGRPVVTSSMTLIHR